MSRPEAARRWMARFAPTLGMICLAATSDACVNTFESEILHLQSAGDEATVAKIVARLEANYRSEPTLRNSNDLAVSRLLTRRYAEAIELLEETERRHPGMAIVAANLGTAYELSGDDPNALRWIRAGVERDPDEHSGTEWLHVMILEAKLALAEDPDWLNTHTVLGVGFGDAEVPQLPATLPPDGLGGTFSPRQVAKALSYQLHERTKFVKPPDSIVADLYSAAGDIQWTIGSPDLSDDDYLGPPSQLYEAALKYGPVNRLRVERRLGHFNATYPDDSWYPRYSPESRPETARRSRARPWVTMLLIAGSVAAVLLAVRRRLTKP